MAKPAAKSDTDTRPASTGVLDVRTLERTAADEREQRERAALTLADGRRRRRGARTDRDQVISMKTTLAVKKMMADMADAEGKSYTEIFEDAIQRRHAAMRGSKT
jgi:hypothetical protein